MGSCLSFLFDAENDNNNNNNNNAASSSSPTSKSPLVEVNDSRATQAIDMGNYHSIEKMTQKQQQQQPVLAQDPVAATTPSAEEDDEDVEQTPLQFILNMTGQHKPLDASDVTPTTLQDATDEIIFIRKFAAEYLAAWEGAGVEGSGVSSSGGILLENGGSGARSGRGGGGNSSRLGCLNLDKKTEDKDDHVDQAVRFALYDKPKQDFTSFTKISYDKSPEVRDLIYNAIRPNALFEFDTREEILQIIDVFKPVSLRKGQCVVRQGESGSEFYVVESGELSIHVTVRGGEGGHYHPSSVGIGGGGEPSEVKVGSYTKGSAFGELALIFGSPRAATITAMADNCKVWSLERDAYRSVISQIRYNQHKEKNAFLKTCVVSGNAFTDLFDEYQLEDLTIATKVDVYEAGEVILRQGEMGDTFYIVKSGRVDTYRKKGSGEEMVGSIEEKKTFGTTSLLKGAPNPYTYKAANRVTVFYLTRLDFETMMGRLQDVIDGNTVARTVHAKDASRDTSRRTFTTSMSHEEKYKCELHDLEHFKNLGRGAFGTVTLVQATKSKKVFALKAQSKDVIVKKGQQEHVLNELNITSEIEHPSIVRIHCAMQDDKYLYFLLDLLPGGELMHYLREVIKERSTQERKGFPEEVTKFYAASVLLAFEVLHLSLIAYRDLKPENICLSKKGYGVLVDFGLAKEITGGQTYTFCGTADYLAPEVLRRTGHNWAVDYWCLGVFLFEMTHGTAPFFAKNSQTRIRKILRGFDSDNVPSHFSGGLRDLISNLLNSDQSKRLGRVQNGIDAIKNHRWFAGFDWDGLLNQTLKAPIQPDIPSDIKSIGKEVSGNPALVAASDWWPDISSEVNMLAQ